MVEHRLPKPGVAGSIPVSRSSNHKDKAAAQTSMLTLRLFDFVGDGLLLRAQPSPPALFSPGILRSRAGEDACAPRNTNITAPSTRGI